jgi:MFS family permease
MNSPSLQRDATYRKVAWRLVPLLMLGYLSAFIDRSNIGFAKLQFVSQLGFSETVYGIGGGLFYLGYCLFEVPSNLLLVRSGARRTFLRIMITWSLCSASMCLATSATHYYLLRFLMGAAEAGFFPGVLFYLGQWAPASRRARLTALFMAAMTLSGVIGGPLAGAIMSGADGQLGLHGWQWLFIFEGLPGCAIGVLTYYLLPDRPEEARWLDESQRAQIADDLRTEAMTLDTGATRSFSTCGSMYSPQCRWP